MDSYYFERSYIPDKMEIGEKYIIFISGQKFELLGYYLGITINIDSEIAYCFGESTEIPLANSKQMHSHDLLFVYKKVKGVLVTNNGSSMVTSNYVDDTRMFFNDCFVQDKEFSINVLKMGSGFNSSLYKSKMPANVNLLGVRSQLKPF
jgi:hypothetical protein